VGGRGVRGEVWEEVTAYCLATCRRLAPYSESDYRRFVPYSL